MSLSELHSKLVVLPLREAHRIKCLDVGYDSDPGPLGCSVCHLNKLCLADLAKKAKKAAS